MKGQNNGHLPFFLTKIIAYAFLYDNKSDQMSMLIRDYTKFYGISGESVKKFSVSSKGSPNCCS